jgi:hypothetical protein
MRKLLAILLSCFFFIDCPLIPSLEFDTRDFMIEWELWESLNINNYSLIFDTANAQDGGAKGRIVVENGIIIKLDDWYLNDSSYLPYWDESFVLRNMKTIPELYEWIDEKYRSVKTRFRSRKMTISIIYNEDYHFPEYVRYNDTRKLPNSNIIGDDRSVTYRLTEFKILTTENN